MSRLGEGLSVLIVEDEVDLGWALAEILERDGHCPQTAATGRDGLALAEQNAFDLAIVDAKLPDLAGEEVARQLAALRPALPVILISGYFDPEDWVIVDAMNQGVYRGFLPKPFDLGELRRVIVEVTAAPQCERLQPVDQYRDSVEGQR